MTCKLVEGHVRKPAQELRQSLGLDYGAMRLTKSLNATKGVFPVVGSKIEIIECHRFLVRRIVRLARDRHEGRVVMAHVVASHLIRAVGESRRMHVVRG